MNQKRLEALNTLGTSGRANADEIARAQTDYQTAVAEIERRVLRSPIDGIVTRVYREVAESVTGIETIVVTVVNLDSLELTAHVDTQRARQLKLGQEIDAMPVRGEQPAITYISPVIDSSSDTVRVKLELSNQEHQYMSGGKYHLHFKTAGSLAHRVIESDE